MVRTLTIVALVLVILLLAIPLGIATVMGPCPECPSVAMAPMAICLAVLTELMVLATFGSTALLSFSPRQRVLLLARSLDRPPRFA